jgi:hypothetical protein
MLSLTCDETCQNDKTAYSLYQKYLDAKTNVSSAPTQLNTATQDYITYMKGSSGYQDYQEQQLETNANAAADTYLKKNNDEVNKIKSEIATYDNLFINYANVVDLNEKYIKDIHFIRNKLKTKSSDILTNDRKTYYEDQENDNLKYYYYILSIFYLILLVIYIILFFTHSSSVGWAIRLLIFIVLVIYYFIGTFLLGKIMAWINKIIKVFPKNVYTDL